MKVRELKKILENVDDECEVVSFAPGFGGFEEPNLLVKQLIGGIGQRLSFDEINCVYLTSGNLEYMKSQGIEVYSVDD